MKAHDKIMLENEIAWSKRPTTRSEETRSSAKVIMVKKRPEDDWRWVYALTPKGVRTSH